MYNLSVTFSLSKYFHKLQRWKQLTNGLTRLQYYTTFYANHEKMSLKLHYRRSITFIGFPWLPKSIAANCFMLAVSQRNFPCLELAASSKKSEEKKPEFPQKSNNVELIQKCICYAHIFPRSRMNLFTSYNTASANTHTILAYVFQESRKNEVHYV